MSSSKGIPFKTMKPIEYIPNWDKLLNATIENEFINADFELLKESVIYLSISANSYQGTENGEFYGWDRNNSIVPGLLIRSCRLLTGFFSEIVANRMDTAFILQRSIAETLINSLFLLKENNQKLYEDYIKYSLKHEKSLFLRIKSNILERGYELPIESRMLKSILLAFERSGVSIENIDEMNKKTWGGSIYQKFKKVGLEEQYLSIFGGLSHSVHGNWQDLLSNDLDFQGNKYYPKLNRQSVKPQPLGALNILIIAVTGTYTIYKIPACDEKKQILRRLFKIKKMVKDVMELHEGYISKNMKKLDA